MFLPNLIIVTGRPGAGKTTFAEKLSKQMYYPLVSRDKIKEGYINTIQKKHSEAGEEVNKKIYNSFFKLIDILLKDNISLIAEAAFQHTLWSNQLNKLSEISQIKIVICDVDPALARERTVNRLEQAPLRDWYHGDKSNLMQPKTEYQPPKFPFLTLNIDTTDGYEPSLDKLIKKIGNK